jgi:hypothetical protein
VLVGVTLLCSGLARLMVSLAVRRHSPPSSVCSLDTPGDLRVARRRRSHDMQAAHGRDERCPLEAESHGRSAWSAHDRIMCAWRQREHEDMIACLREENRVLKVRLKGQRLRLDDPERRRLRSSAIGWDARHYARSQPW